MKKQLTSSLGDFEIWDYFSPIDNRLHFVEAVDIPFIRYPNRVPCFEANLYMQSKLHQGLSRKIKGGTLRTYAMNIAHLIRYCYNNGLRFSQLNDSSFTLFIRGLQAETNLKGERIRGVNQVLKIGRQCIDFLLFIGNLHSLKGFVGIGQESAIRIVEKKHKINIEDSNKKKEICFFEHKSFPTPQAVKRRSPISNDAASKIKGVIDEQPDKHIRRRDRCIYQSLEQTGARRTEVTLLRVSDVMSALDNGTECPLLQLKTLKRKDNTTYRALPVPRVFLENLHNYIRTTRRKIIKSTIGISNDHGFLFVSHTTGQQLSPDTISTYMIKWRKAAGIEEAAFAHLLRHAFITEKLKCLILEYDFESKDEFRKSLYNTKQFKMQLKEWTGHTQLYSLDTYIDIAFSDLSGIKKTYSLVSLRSSVDIIEDKIEELELDLQKGTKTFFEVTQELQGVLTAFRLDINRSIEVT
ncbi:tyrosine-type recombinase/integrase [Vibrio sp. CDRSL-10 TSBA]